MASFFYWGKIVKFSNVGNPYFSTISPSFDFGTTFVILDPSLTEIGSV